jgi:uncharacterized protein
VSAHDAYHRQATDAANQIARERWNTFTSTLVVAEAHALFLARLGWHHATAFLRQMETTTTTVLPVTADEEARAREIIYQYTDKRFSFTDATSFALMERHRIGVALTLDHNFVQYGFRALGL